MLLLEPSHAGDDMDLPENAWPDCRSNYRHSTAICQPHKHPAGISLSPHSLATDDDARACSSSGVSMWTLVLAKQVN